MMSELDGLLLKLSGANHLVPKGSMWRHKKTGNLYTVVDLVVIESDLTLGVSYKPLVGSTKLHWVRPLEEFLDGRFEKVDLFKGV